MLVQCVVHGCFGASEQQRAKTQVDVEQLAGFHRPKGSAYKLSSRIEAFDTFGAQDDKWDSMFDSLIEHGEHMDEEWGPLRVTAASEY